MRILAFLAILFFCTNAFAVNPQANRVDADESTLTNNFSGSNCSDVQECLETIDNLSLGGTGTMNAVKENDVAVGGSDIVTLDFLGADFNLTESPDTEIQIVIDDGGIDHDSTTNFTATEHFTEGSIDHGSIAGLSDDDHAAYMLDTGDTATGNYTFDTDTFFIDATGNEVGVGTTSPSSLFNARGGLTTVGALVTLSTEEPTVVDGDKLGQINFDAPLETGADALLAGASIWAEADGTFSATVNDTDLVFATGLSALAAERMRLNSSGDLLLGTTSDTLMDGVAGLLSYGASTSALGVANANIAFLLYTVNSELRLYDSTSNIVRMVVDSSGLFTMTTNTANAGLTLTGVSNPTIKVIDSSVGGADFRLQAGGDNMFIGGVGTTDDFHFVTDFGGNNEGLTLDASDGTASFSSDLLLNGTLSLVEQADANADVDGEGQIWVNTATPNELWFTDDAGTDVQLGVDTNAEKLFSWQAAATNGTEAADSNAALSKDAGTNVDSINAAYDAAADECRGVVFNVPNDVDTSGTATFQITWYSKTATTGNVIWDARWHEVNEGESWDAALTTDAAAADAVQGTVDLVTETAWTETLSNLGWTADEEVILQWCRDADNASDTLVGDAEAQLFSLRIPRA